MRHTRWRTAALAGCGAMLLVAACGSPSPPVPTPTSAPPPTSTSPTPTIEPSATLSPSPSADPIRSALTATMARGTARLEVELLTAANGVERNLAGEGLVDLARGAADLTWSAVEGTSREIRTEDGFFVEVEPGQWLAVEPGRITPTSQAWDVLQGLADLREPVASGSEVIGGQSATRITGWVPAAGNADGLGLIDPERAVVDANPQARIEVTVWIDPAGRIVQVLRTLQQVPGVAATSLARISDFGAAAAITTPTSIAATAN